MNINDVSRREALKQGGSTLTGLALLQSSWLAHAFPNRPGEETVRWLDQPPPNPSAGAVENLQPTEELGSWITPNDKFFSVAHYRPAGDRRKHWKLEIDGLVKQAADPDA